MGKRVSAVAVLLATSFLGSLLALVLVGRNPLVGPSSDLARTESLQDGVEGSPVTVPGGPASSTSSATSGGSEAVDEAVRAAGEAGPLETAYRPGPAAAGGTPGAEPPGDGEQVQPSEEDDAVVAKTTSEVGNGNGNGNANGHDKEKGKDASDEEPTADVSDDAVAGSSGSSKGGPKGPKEPKASNGGDDGSGGSPAGEKSKGSGKGPKAETAKGSGKGTKVQKDRGPGEGASEPPGKGKSKT